jgi:hypothetical protein
MIIIEPPFKACPRRGVAEDRLRAGARGGENYGGDSTIRRGNKPPPSFILMKKPLNYRMSQLEWEKRLILILSLYPINSFKIFNTIRQTAEMLKISKWKADNALF